jgi:hypothetical protein
MKKLGLLFLIAAVAITVGVSAFAQTDPTSVSQESTDRKRKKHKKHRHHKNPHKGHLKHEMPTT